MQILIYALINQFHIYELNVVERGIYTLQGGANEIKL